jgi:ABC-type antimicrobial peptide transport system ATPase subunit
LKTDPSTLAGGEIAGIVGGVVSGLSAIAGAVAMIVNFLRQRPNDRYIVGEQSE